MTYARVLHPICRAHVVEQSSPSALAPRDQ